MSVALPVGVGLGWRPETARLVERRPLAFSEVIAESIDLRRIPPALAFAVERGLPVVTHGVGLDLAGTNRLDRERIRRLVRAAHLLKSPLVSEHVAFSRAGEHTSAHFLPVPRTRAQLAWLVDRVHRVQDALPVPLALENIAAPVAWPGDELDEADFLAALIDRTDAYLLLDASNLHANLVNHGGDLDRYLDRLPLDRVAYLHAAGGAVMPATGMYRDTHAHPLDAPVAATVARILARTGPLPLLLERDAHHDDELAAELVVLAALLASAVANPAATSRRRPALELPTVDDSLRVGLAAQHAALFAALAGDASSFDRRHLDETRDILGVKANRVAHVARGRTRVPVWTKLARAFRVARRAANGS